MLQQHPFITEFSEGIVFPSQNIPLSRKTDAWKKANMDAMENFARIQYSQKQGLLKNYKLINGELLEDEYGLNQDIIEANKDNADNFDILEFATEKLGIPGFVKNYDIIGQPVRTLEGELDSLPDVFNVVGKGELFESEKQRVKTELLREWFMGVVTSSINKKLGYDVPPEFEEAEQEEEYNQQVKAMTPPEIEYYMSVSYKHVLVEWGQNELEDQFERFKIKSLRRREFHHFLVAGERYRRIFKSAKGLDVESLNPLYVFSVKSPSIEFTQDGDIAGVIKVLTVPAIIDNYGHKLTDKEINSLEESYYSKTKEMDYGKHIDGSPIKYLSPTGEPYQTRLPLVNKYNFPGFSNNMLAAGAGSSSAFMSEEELSKISGTTSGGMFNNANKMLVVVEGYWRSQRRIGKLTTWNPLAQEIQIDIVDESYEVPDYIKEIRNEKPNYNAGVNTLVWTRETQIWEGIKIANYNSDGILREPLYVAVQPAEIQIGKLLIAGQYANNINTKPTSLVDRLKPWQFFYNVLINQCYHYFETELAPFIIMGTDMIPNIKDHGGEDGLAKWLESAKEGIAIADLSPTTNGNPMGGQFPKVMDLDMSARILSRMNLALQIKQLALEQVGISPQRLGEVGTQETATGIAQAVNSSGVQTSTWFTSFFECEKDILQMQLDAAKILQAEDGEFNVSNYRSDLTTQALKFSIEDGNLYELHIYVTDNQEELRNIELAKQLALNNNTSDMQMSDRIEMATSSSVRTIVSRLRKSESDAIARMQQEMQLKQQELQQNGMTQQAALEQAERHFYAKLENELKVATIRALGNSRDNDINQNSESDVLEYVKLINATDDMNSRNENERSKQQLERDKFNSDTRDKAADRRLKEKQMISDQVLADKKIKQAKIQGDKSK